MIFRLSRECRHLCFGTAAKHRSARPPPAQATEAAPGAGPGIWVFGNWPGDPWGPDPQGTRHGSARGHSVWLWTLREFRSRRVPHLLTDQTDSGAASTLHPNTLPSPVPLGAEGSDRVCVWSESRGLEGHLGDHLVAAPSPHCLVCAGLFGWSRERHVMGRWPEAR